MAAPKRASNPWRPLAVVLVAMIALYLGVGLGKTHSPALGLDLSGGTTVLMKPNVQGGQKVSADQLSKSVTILRQRINSYGVGNAEVRVEGSDRIRVNVPGEGRDAVEKIKRAALVRFRQVLIEAGAAATPDATTTVVPTTPASPDPSVSGSAPASVTPSASASPSASKTSNGRAVPNQFLAASATPTPTASATATPTGSATPASSASPTAASPAPSTSATVPDNTPPPLVSGLPLRQSLQGIDKETLAQFSSFVCPAADKVKAVVDDTDANKDKAIPACDHRGNKYLLGPQLFPGDQIRKATAGLVTQSASDWQVNLELKGDGADIFSRATTAVVKYASPFNQIAVVLDGVVESAPVIQGAITGGQAQISGNFTEAEATDLAKILEFGALPVAFTVDTVSTVSPTLGSDQLRAGLIAGGIALILVILYSLLYYRALGIVTVASLAASAALLYATLVLLGHSIGYTLTLAGIAGFIIAVGITADSFVVYFERLRDEIRDGRTPRVAVERGWERARRTILSADFVSLLAAGVLYFVSIGEVRGFAFTLGLSTISDLIIVFLFTKPLITLMVRSKFFANHPRASGLADRVDLGPATAPSTAVIAGSEA